MIRPRRAISLSIAELYIAQLGPALLLGHIHTTASMWIWFALWLIQRPRWLRWDTITQLSNRCPEREQSEWEGIMEGKIEGMTFEREAHVNLENTGWTGSFPKLTNSYLFIASNFKRAVRCFFQNQTFSSSSPLSHKKNCFNQTIIGKICFPTALRQLHGMQRKNAFPSHGSLPRQSPVYLPTPREKKKSERFYP